MFGVASFGLRARPALARNPLGAIARTIRYDTIRWMIQPERAPHRTTSQAGQPARIGQHPQIERHPWIGPPQKATGKSRNEPAFAHQPNSGKEGRTAPEYEKKAGCPPSLRIELLFRRRCAADRFCRKVFLLARSIPLIRRWRHGDELEARLRADGAKSRTSSRHDGSTGRASGQIV